jgi:hypothetical protein
MILGHLPKIAVNYENGFALAMKVSGFWKGRVADDLAETILVDAL